MHITRAQVSELKLWTWMLSSLLRQIELCNSSHVETFTHRLLTAGLFFLKVRWGSSVNARVPHPCLVPIPSSLDSVWSETSCPILLAVQFNTYHPKMPKMWTWVIKSYRRTCYIKAFTLKIYKFAPDLSPVISGESIEWRHFREGRKAEESPFFLPSYLPSSMANSLCEMLLLRVDFFHSLYTNIITHSWNNLP